MDESSLQAQQIASMIGAPADRRKERIGWVKYRPIGSCILEKYDYIGG
jgi:hypothetical protein